MYFTNINKLLIYYCTSFDAIVVIHHDGGDLSSVPGFTCSQVVALAFALTIASFDAIVVIHHDGGDPSSVPSGFTCPSALAVPPPSVSTIGTFVKSQPWHANPQYAKCTF
jgi:hypothetical protein